METMMRRKMGKKMRKEMKRKMRRMVMMIRMVMPPDIEVVFHRRVLLFLTWL